GVDAFVEPRDAVEVRAREIDRREVLRRDAFAGLFDGELGQILELLRAGVRPHEHRTCRGGFQHAPARYRIVGHRCPPVRCSSRPRRFVRRIARARFRYYGRRIPRGQENDMAYLWVAIGGALGSVARYGCSGLALRWLGAGFPYGTLFVNVVGSF